VRALFFALLCAAAAVPPARVSPSSYPGVSRFWVLVPFAALFVLVLVDARHPRRVRNLDSLALVFTVAALGLSAPTRPWAILLIYVPLAYLAVRMALIARLGRRGIAAQPGNAFSSAVPCGWLVLGVVILAVVHVNWTLSSTGSTDVGKASVHGAMSLIRGDRLYGTDHALNSQLGSDPHFDTYGPANYEAYVPASALATGRTAERLTALFFDLLTAALLFVLGARTRDAPTGTALAFAWLAFPFTLYADELSVNDSLVAATVLATILMAQHPGRRGAMAALAAWIKLSPLALVPLMAGQDMHGLTAKRALRAFASAFLVLSVLVFLPVVLDGSIVSFLGRTFGFQFSRASGSSVWELASNSRFFGGGQLVRTSAGVAHGLLAALAGAFVVALLWMPRRRDRVGLAAASAAVLIVVQFCDGYYTFTYVLWFVPAALAALLLDHGPAAPSEAPGAV
jgi:hypothetical protein